MTASAAPSPVRSSRSSSPKSARRKPRVSLAGPALGRDHAVLVGRAMATNPYNPNERIEVAVNRRVDILAQERAAGRISEADFLVGRMCQEVWERQSGSRMGSGGWNPGSSRDQTVAHELQIRYAIRDAAKAKAFSDEVAGAIGWTGVKILKRFLVEGQTFVSYAGFGASHHAATKVGDRFRFLLWTLTEALHTATGAEGQRIRATRDQS